MNAQGQIERSFGSETGIYRPDLRDVIEIRPITATRGGVWSAWINQYVLEQWDTAGHLIRIPA